MSHDATDGQTRKDRATQPLDAGRLSFAKILKTIILPVTKNDNNDSNINNNGVDDIYNNNNNNEQIRRNILTQRVAYIEIWLPSLPLQSL